MNKITLSNVLQIIPKLPDTVIISVYDYQEVPKIELEVSNLNYKEMHLVSDILMDNREDLCGYFKQLGRKEINPIVQLTRINELLNSKLSTDYLFELYHVLTKKKRFLRSPKLK